MGISWNVNWQMCIATHTHTHKTKCDWTVLQSGSSEHKLHIPASYKNLPGWTQGNTLKANPFWTQSKVLSVQTAARICEVRGSLLRPRIINKTKNNFFCNKKKVELTVKEYCRVCPSFSSERLTQRREKLDTGFISPGERRKTPTQVLSMERALRGSRAMQRQHRYTKKHPLVSLREGFCTQLSTQERLLFLYSFLTDAYTKLGALIWQGNELWATHAT